MATMPPVVMPDENKVEISCGNLLKISGTNSTESPKEKLNAITKMALRFIFCVEMILTPAAATVPNMSKVAPPNTGSGIKAKILPTAGNIPNTTKNKGGFRHKCGLTYSLFLYLVQIYKYKVTNFTFVRVL